MDRFKVRRCLYKKMTSLSHFPRVSAHYTEAILFLSMKYVEGSGDKCHVSFGFLFCRSRRENRLKGIKSRPSTKTMPMERAWYTTAKLRASAF